MQKYLFWIIALFGCFSSYVYAVGGPGEYQGCDGVSITIPRPDPARDWRLPTDNLEDIDNSADIIPETLESLMSMRNVSYPAQGGIQTDMEDDGQTIVEPIGSELVNDGFNELPDVFAMITHIVEAFDNRSAPQMQTNDFNAETIELHIVIQPTEPEMLVCNNIFIERLRACPMLAVAFVKAWKEIPDNNKIGRPFRDCLYMTINQLIENLNARGRLLNDTNSFLESYTLGVQVTLNRILRNCDDATCDQIVKWLQQIREIRFWNNYLEHILDLGGCSFEVLRGDFAHQMIAEYIFEGYLTKAYDSDTILNKISNYINSHNQTKLKNKWTGR